MTTTPDRTHRRLAKILTDAADGRFPMGDASWVQVPPWRGGVEAVVAFTGFAVLAVEGTVPGPVDGFGGAHDPRLITALAGPDGWIDSLDALLVARGTGGPAVLVDRPDLAAHPRVTFAPGRPRRRARPRPSGRAGRRRVGPRDRRAHRAEHGGRAGPPWRRSSADPRRAGLVPAGEVVAAAVAPGNAASLRALLAVGFSPIGSVQLFRRP